MAQRYKSFQERMSTLWLYWLFFGRCIFYNSYRNIKLIWYHKVLLCLKYIMVLKSTRVPLILLYQYLMYFWLVSWYNLYIYLPDTNGQKYHGSFSDVNTMAHKFQNHDIFISTDVFGIWYHDYTVVLFKGYSNVYYGLYMALHGICPNYQNTTIAPCPKTW